MASVADACSGGVASEKEWLGDYVMQFLKSSSWTKPIEEFISKNCIFFDLTDPEENKLEYTGIHTEFKGIIESLLAAHLLDVDVSPDEFAVVFESCCKNDVRLAPVAAQLASVDDFLVFKKMMIVRNQAAARAAEQHEPAGEAIPPPSEEQEQMRLLLSQLTSASPAELSGSSVHPCVEQCPPPCEPGKPQDDLLPPMPTLDPSKMRSNRIAAIVANATKAKSDNKEKAALVSIAGKAAALGSA